MLAHIAIKKDRFEATLRYLIADSVQAFKDPLMIGNEPFFLEGAKVNSVQVSLAPQERTMTVNVAAGAGVAAASGLSPITYRMLQVQVDMDVLLISESAMKAANFNPPADVVDIPLHGIDFWLYIEVDPTGTPRIHLQPYPGQADITGRFAVDAPLPLGQALGALGGPGTGRVLNAGIHFASDANVVMRVETDAAPLPTPWKRWIDWSQLFDGRQDSLLSGREWAVEAPTDGLRASVEAQARSSLKNGKSFEFTQMPWVSWIWDQPALQLHTQGFIPHACAGNDLNVKLWVTVRLSVPPKTAPNKNVVRVTFRIDYEKDKWDTFKCIVLSTFLWPIIGLVTFFDNKVPWWGFSAYFVLLACPFLIPPLFLAAELTGVEESLVGSVVSDEIEKSADNLTKVSDYEYYRDIPIPPLDPQRDWVSLDEISAVGDRLLLRGAILTPPPVMPRLSGELTEPFGTWGYKDRCSNPNEREITATIDLKLAGDTAPKPNVEIKGSEPKTYGVWNIPYQIMDDTQGFYAGQSSLIHYTGIPGRFEIKLKASSAGIAGIFDFGQNPYPLCLRLLTSGGARQFELTPPAIPVPARPLTPQQARDQYWAETRWKMANCYRAGHVLVLKKLLELLWLVDPQADARIAQYWIIYVSGLSQEGPLVAWDVRQGLQLASAEVVDGAAEIRLRSAPGTWTDRIQLTLGDTSPISEDAYRELLAGTETPSEATSVRVDVLQTRLVVEQTISFDAPADWIEVVEDRGTWQLDVATGERLRQYRVTALDGPVLRAVRSLDRCAPGMRGAEQAPRIRSDRAALAGDLYVELAADRRTATLYRRDKSVRGGVQV